MKRCAWLAALPVGIFAACGLAAAAGVRVNTTPSVPVGLYHVSQPDGALGRGDTVELCVPPWPHVVLPSGDCPHDIMPLVKPIAAVAGDVVEISPRGVSVNGTLTTRPAPEASAAPRMADGVYRVQPGEAWILSDYHARSFDSRYFGPVSLASIRAQATPLLVVR